MTWVEIITVVLMGLVVGVFILGMVGLCTMDDYVPMSLDQEYQWLTEQCGLSHDEALEVMGDDG